MLTKSKKFLETLFKELLILRNSTKEHILLNEIIQVLRFLFTKLKVEKNFCNSCFTNIFKERLINKTWFRICTTCGRKNKLVF